MRRFRLPVLVGGFALISAAVVLAIFAGIGTSASRCVGTDSGIGAGALATVDCPMPGAYRVSLAQAASVLGAPVKLPNSVRASSADVGTVWASRLVHSGVGQSVAVTFPSRGFAVRYTRPVPYDDALANYEAFARVTPSARVIYLNGVPALTQTGRRTGGSTWNAVEFVSHGTMIAVMGTARQSSLQAAARAIVAQG